MANASWIGSPNFTSTNGRKIDLIVLHWMAGTLASTDAVFQDEQRQTSAHYGVEDQIVHQYVREQDIAFHAGVWTINQRSIGVEHSAKVNRPASELTYATTIQLIVELCRRYSLTEANIHVHREYYATQCPGTLDVDRIKQGVAQALRGGIIMTVGIDVARCMAYWSGRDGRDGRPNARAGETDQDLVKYHEKAQLNRDYVFGWINGQEMTTYIRTLDEVYAERNLLRERVKELEAKLSADAQPLKPGKYIVV